MSAASENADTTSAAASCTRSTHLLTVPSPQVRKPVRQFGTQNATKRSGRTAVTTRHVVMPIWVDQSKPRQIGAHHVGVPGEQPVSRRDVQSDNCLPRTR